MRRYFIQRYNRSNILNNRVTDSKVRSIGAKTVSVYLASENAPPSDRLESPAHPANSCEQIDERKRAALIATLAPGSDQCFQHIHDSAARDGVTSFPSLNFAATDHQALCQLILS